jgi:hypothetical protein
LRERERERERGREWERDREERACVRLVSVSQREKKVRWYGC